MIYVMFGIYVILASSGLLLFKAGSTTGLMLQMNSLGFHISINWLSLIGIVCYLGSFLLWLYIVSQTKLTWAMPLSVGLINTVIYIASAIFFKEQIGVIQVVGVFLVAAGVTLISVQK